MVMGPFLGSMLMGAVRGATGSPGAAKRRINPATGKPYPRRRRFKLSLAQRADLDFVAKTIGKTAAASYLNLLRR